MNLENENQTPQEDTESTSPQPQAEEANPQTETTQPQEPAEASGEADAIHEEAAAAQPAIGATSLEDAASAQLDMGESLTDEPQAEPSPAQEPEAQPASEQPAFIPPPAVSGGPEQPAGAQPGAAGKPGKKPVVIIGVCAAVLAVIVLAVALLVPQLSKSMNPEEYLNKAMANTGKALEDSVSYIPDLQQFNGNPWRYDFTFSADPESIATHLSGFPLDATMNGSLLMDAKGEKMFLEVNFKAAGISINGNKLFVSPDLVAFAIPMAYSKSEYITFNPGTFKEDFDSSQYGIYSEFPEEIDLRGFIQGLFQYQSEMEDEFLENYQEAVEQLAQELVDSAEFNHEGSSTVTTGGKENKVEVMTRTYPVAAVQNYYLDYLDLYKDYYMGRMELFQPLMGYEWEYMQEELEDMFEVFQNIEVMEPITVTYLVDTKQQVVGIEMKEFDFRVYNQYSDRYEQGSIGMNIDFVGEGNITDAFTGEVVFGTPYDVLFINFNRRHIQDGGKDSDRLVVDMQMDDEIFTMDLSFQYEPQATGDNMRLLMEFIGDYADLGMEVTGNLSESSGEVALTGGRVSFQEEGEDVFSFLMELTGSTIAASDLDIDFSDSASLFDVEMEDFFSLFRMLSYF